MSMNVDREKLKELAVELAKDIKTEKDLNALSSELLKMTGGTGRRNGSPPGLCQARPQRPGQWQ
jgi:hypothetical protein